MLFLHHDEAVGLDTLLQPLTQVAALVGREALGCFGLNQSDHKASDGCGVEVRLGIVGKAEAANLWEEGGHLAEHVGGEGLVARIVGELLVEHGSFGGELQQLFVLIAAIACHLAELVGETE